MVTSLSRGFFNLMISKFRQFCPYTSKIKPNWGGKNESKSLPILFVEKAAKFVGKKSLPITETIIPIPTKVMELEVVCFLQYLYETLVKFGVKFCFFFNTKTQLWGLVIFLITTPYIGWYQDILISLLQSLGPAYGLLHAMSYVLAQGLRMKIIFLPYFKVDCCVL